ncbi:MAG TPA: hypothetical protein VLS93_17105 [Anaeromyxobacteraceae bacterium]|nr:hypothetical protein [Anaeromyxobacteraceae bacterium]
MKKTILLALFLPSLASAQISASAGIRIDLPVVLPQLVVVSPGIQVVPSVPYEVFYVNGFYWVREDGGWYRSRSHRGGWMLVPAARVPPGLVRIPPGRYKAWKPAKGEHGGHHGDHDGDHGRRGPGKGKKGKH